MAKIYKIELYVVDCNNELENLEDIIVHAKGGTFFETGKVYVSKEFKWDDDLIINKTHSTISDLEAYFNKVNEVKDNG